MNDGKQTIEYREPTDADLDYVAGGTAADVGKALWGEIMTVIGGIEVNQYNPPKSGNKIL